MKFKRWQVAVLALCLLCPLIGTASAHQVPDLRCKGSITVEMIFDGRAVSGGTLTACYVGEIQEDDGNYTFVKTREMADFPGAYTDVSDPKLAQDIAAFVRERRIPAAAQAENTAGKAVFSDLEPGLYLIGQTKASKGFDPISPFLVTVPMNEDGQYLYDVSAGGKFQIHRAPKSTEPTDPMLPQTGQLNWPVPVLAALGLGLCLTGWILRGKRE